MTSGDLLVLMQGVPAARLRCDSAGRLSLVYDRQYSSSPDAVPLSLSIPFQPGPHGHRRVLCWISSLLPDRSDVLRRWGSVYGATDAFGLLSTRIGHDCAGAVQFCRPDRIGELAGRASGTVPLAQDQLAAEVAAMARDPVRWAADDVEPYFSLGGYQNKLALHRLPSAWARPYGRVPTTHILKPSHAGAGAVAVVEHLCSAAAGRLGLDAAGTALEVLAGHPVVVVERYDRRDGPRGWERVHQEDMCQALGVAGHLRREPDGGPGMGAIAGLLRVHSTDPDADVRKFAEALIWALVTVNRDAHARNYSVMLEAGGTVRLAPLYDLNSSLAYFSSGFGEREMAMRYGGRFTVYSADSDHSLIDTAVRLDLPGRWVIERAESLAGAAVDAFTDEANRLPVEAHEFLETEVFLDRLRKRCDSVAKTAAANRRRNLRSRERPTTP